MRRYSITLKPIGIVRTKATQKDIRANRRNVISEIVLHKDFKDGLLGIEEFSHVYVIYFAHKAYARGKGEMLLHPGGREELPLTGMFATRSPNRPNRIALSLVEVLERKDEILKVKGLDALNGSPVLDIKPYDTFDSLHDIRIPEWWLKLHSGRLS